MEASMLYPYAFNHRAANDLAVPTAYAGSDLCGDVLAGISLPQACGLDLKVAAPLIPSLNQYPDYGVQDLYNFYLPVANGVNTEDEASLNEPITPTFIPGFQDHYTGIVRAVAGLDGAALKPGAEVNAKVASQGPAQFTQEACEEDASMVKANDNSGWLDGPKIASAENHDSAKLQRLIYLQLHCAVEAGTEQPKKLGENFSGDRTPSKATSDEDDVQAGTNDESGMNVPCGVIGVAFSHGSVGHPDTCSAPCKYFRKKRGCMDGLACSHCHLCDWKPRRTQRGRRGGKSRNASDFNDGDSGHSGDLYDNMVE